MTSPTCAYLRSTCARAAGRPLLAAIALAALGFLADSSFAQSPPLQNSVAQSAATETAALPSSDSVQGAGNAQAASLTCTADPGTRKQCPADTSAGVALLKSTGPSACLLGKTWGYDHRLNVQVIDVNRSPVSSLFGYYIGGQDGTTFAAGFSVFFQGEIVSWRTTW